MSTDLNKEVAEFFIGDARDFLKRYSLLKEAATHIGSRSKLLLDLLFAIECILKALVFIESSDDEKRTYNAINKTHDFQKLLNMLDEQTRLQCNKFIEPKLMAYYVRIRYSLESHIDFRTEQGVLGKEYYETIANFHWLDNVNERTKALLEYVSSRNPVAIEVVRLSDVDIDSELRKHARFRGMRGPRIAHGLLKRGSFST